MFIIREVINLPVETEQFCPRETICPTNNAYEKYPKPQKKKKFFVVYVKR